MISAVLPGRCVTEVFPKAEERLVGNIAENPPKKKSINVSGGTCQYYRIQPILDNANRVSARYVCQMRNSRNSRMEWYHMA